MPSHMPDRQTTLPHTRPCATSSRALSRSDDFPIPVGNVDRVARLHAKWTDSSAAATTTRSPSRLPSVVATRQRRRGRPSRLRRRRRRRPERALRCSLNARNNVPTQYTQQSAFDYKWPTRDRTSRTRVFRCLLSVSRFQFRFQFL